MSKAAAKSIAKYIIAFILLAVIVRHVGTEKILTSLRQIPPLDWFFALFFTTLAQVMAAFRMRFFFKAAKFPLGVRFGIILYYVGAFYNFLLPGGIGGDAYKVILARARMNMTAIQGIRIMLADRASGLMILLLVMYGGLYVMDISATIPHANALLALAAIITLLSYLAISERFLKKSPATMLLSLVYSAVSQGFWIATLWVLWSAFRQEHFFLEYVVLYCAASVAGMFPATVGGLGIKEMAYFYGASLIQQYAGKAVDGELGVTLSLCLFVIGFITSLPGLLWLEKVRKVEI